MDPADDSVRPPLPGWAPFPRSNFDEDAEPAAADDAAADDDADVAVAAAAAAAAAGARKIQRSGNWLDTDWCRNIPSYRNNRRPFSGRDPGAPV